jgi:hypothetical protein
MDDDDVIERARAEGFELVERPVGDAWCWGFVREDDERYPAFLDGDRRSSTCTTGCAEDACSPKP